MKSRILALTLVFALVASGVAFAQAELTGALRGTTKLADGSAVPGVLVTATSPALQGQRTTVTGEAGQWIIRNLPPGTYTVTFELEGMATVQSTVPVKLGQDTPVNIEMQVAAEEETIIVTGELSSVLASSEVSTTYDFEQVNNLPIEREPDDIAALAPGLTTNTPNGGQVTISGGFAYDNVFLIDGVDANDNLFGTSNPVYIEDAIADIQVLTSGISAEYGRFTGGVVNVITKSGGNEFSGTLRVDLTNEDWREPTPLEDSGDLVDDISEEYSATLGGYILKDKIWFFGAGRDEESSSQTTLFKTSQTVTNSITEERYEGKLTFNIADKHQLQATITDREQTGVRPSFSFSSTPSTLRTRTDPSDLKVGRYSGVLTPSLFAELQYSEKSFTFMNTHGLDASTTPSTDPSFVENTPFFDFLGNFSGHYNAPYFDGKDPEDRNNEQLAGSLSFFLDTAAAGSHDLKVGFEDFSSFRTGGNSQTPTDWVISALPTTDAAGNPILDANGELTPDWQPFNSGAWQFLANRDAEVELQTQSAFVNDRWQLNDHWSFNIGFRYEEVSGETQSGIVTVDSDAFVPRLGASYDLRGDGKYRFDVTYAQYAGKYSESQFAENTDVGNPPGLFYLYVGPAGTGYDFAPGYDIANNYVPLLADDGTQNVVVDTGITSPTVDEYTLSAGMELERGGFLKAIYTNRAYNDFVEDFITTETGTTLVQVEGVPAGVFSNTFITNSDLPVREYEALQFIGRYRLADNWTLDGNYTYQIKNDGNFEGEGTNTPGISTVIGDYPEIRTQGQHFPIGPLNDFQEHKLRVWTNYNLGLGRAGTLNFGLLMNFDSGRVFSTTTSFGITAEQQAILANLGYVDQPSSQTVYFGRRGDLEFDDSLTFDLAVNYQLPIFSDLRLWIKADIVNLFDDDTQIAGNSIAGDLGGFDALGLPTTFGSVNTDARNNADFVDPREYRFTVGFRF
jgi:hypothetical protein